MHDAAGISGGRLRGEVVGIVPAAGKGTRLGPLPVSKEILPLGFWEAPAPGARAKVASHFLLEHLARAGIRDVYMVVASGKADIVRCLGEGRDVGVRLLYRVMDDSPGTPFTVDSLYPFVRGKTCALGFPDILFSAGRAYAALLDRLEQGAAQIVLGLFPAAQPELVDMVAWDEATARVHDIHIKPAHSGLAFTWGIAAWHPEFTEFLHTHLAGARDDPQVLAELESAAQRDEVYMGDVIRAAIVRGFRAEAVVVSGQPYLDIGTPENLRRAMRTFPTSGRQI